MGELLGNLKISQKLGLAFGVVLTLTIIIGSFAIFEIRKVNGNTVDIATNWLPSCENPRSNSVGFGGTRVDLNSITS